MTDNHPSQPAERHPIQTAIRHIARSLSVALSSHPKVKSFLRSLFLALPAKFRGRQMIHDHLVTVARSGKQSVLLVGANDGVTEDHVYPFVSQHGWSGAAIEPVPQYFEELQRHYAGLSMVCLNMAVHETLEQMPFYYLEDSKDAPLPAYAKGVGSFSRDRVVALSREIPDLADRLRVINVSCGTLDQSLRKAGMTAVDIIVIDTEGYDANVVRQIDFAKWNPHTIIFEHKLLSRDELDACLRLLEANGYALQKDRADVLAIRPGGTAKPQA